MVVMICQYPGLSSIAIALNIKIATIRTHLKHIYRKTSTYSKAMLMSELQKGPAYNSIKRHLKMPTHSVHRLEH